MVGIKLAFYGIPKAAALINPTNMLSMIFKNALGVPFEVTWSIGSKTPFLDPQIVWQVGHASADGEELEFIKATMPSLPMATTASGKVVWYGDFAKFIAGNLPS